MATDTRTLTVEVNAVDNASDTLNKVSKSTDSLSKGIGETLKKNTVALAGAFATVTGAIYTSITAFMESEDAVFALSSALDNLANTGENITGVQDNVLALAASLQSMSRYSDEAIASASTLMLRLGVGTDTIEEATKATVDMATAMGLDLQSAAQAVGLALAYPTEALGRLRRQGIIFTDDQEKMIKSMVESGKTAEAQSWILNELGDRFEGSAAKGAKTFGGQLDILKNSVNDLQETIGAGLVAQLLNLIGGVDNISGKIAQLTAFFKEHQDVLMGVAGALGIMAIGLGVLLASALAVAAGTTVLFAGAIGALLAVIGFAVGYIIANWGALSELFSSVGVIIVTTIETLKASITDFLVNIGENITNFVTIAWASLTKFFTEDIPFMIGFMVGWVMGVIPAFIEQFVAWFLDLPARIGVIFTTVLNTVTTILLAIMAWITKEVSTWPTRIIDFIKNLPALVTKVFDDVKIGVLTKMQELWAGVTEWWDKIKGVIQSIIDLAEKALGKVAEGIEAGKKGFTSRQYGGYVPTTGLALLHEGEFVVSKDMMAGRTGIPSSVSQTYNQPITINPTLSGEPDFDLLGYKLAWVLRNAR
jgi:hypothetical protein